MIFGVDSAYAATAPAALVAKGFTFAAGYIGGSALHVWSNSDWHRQKRAGLKLLPIWVAPLQGGSYDAGVYDGNQALVAMQQVGLRKTMALDCEELSLPEEYCDGFLASVHAGACRLGPYATPANLARLAGLSWDFTWAAMWVTSGADLASVPASSAIWQFSSGATFDFNVAQDDFEFADL